MQMRQGISRFGAVAIVLGLALLAGCQSADLRAERDQLWEQSEELQDRNLQLLAAQDSLEAENVRLRDENEQLRQQVAQRQAQPEPTAPARANTGFGDIAGVETEQRGGEIAVRVPGDVLFASGRATLRNSAKQTLNQIASVIQREYAGHNVRIEGYTDSDPIRKSDWTDNLELSLHRAAAVERYLQERGLDAERVYSAGFGSARSRQTKAQSRRVEIVVLQE